MLFTCSVRFGFGLGNRTLINLFAPFGFGQNGKTLLRSFTTSLHHNMTSLYAKQQLKLRDNEVKGKRISQN